MPHRSTALQVLPILLAATAACATVGTAAGPGERLHPAQQSLPPAAALAEGPEQALLAEVTAGLRRAEAGGAEAEARRERLVAGSRLAALGEGGSPWRLVYRAAGARLLLEAGDAAGAARVAGQLVDDPAADPASRAAGARIRASALGRVAAEAVAAGRLEPLGRGAGGSRARAKVEPRPVPDGWRGLLEAADAYAALGDQDPDPGAPEAVVAATYQAASILLAHGQPEEAVRRLRSIVERHPGSPLLAEAVGLWLQALAQEEGTAGKAAVLDAAQGALDRERRRLALLEPSPEQRVRFGRLARVEAQLAQERQGLPFGEARRLLAAGRQVEAATAFEAFAAANPDHPDAPRALFDAGLAWSAANEPKRAIAVRDRLGARHPADPVAGRAVVLAAADLADAGDHAGAAQRYAQYLDQYPAGEERCTAMLNLGVALDASRQTAEAARRLAAFGADRTCATSADAAARALYRAASLHERARQRAESQSALRALAGLAGVTDPEARAWVEDARSRLR